MPKNIHWWLCMKKYTRTHHNLTYLNKYAAKEVQLFTYTSCKGQDIKFNLVQSARRTQTYAMEISFTNNFWHSGSTFMDSVSKTGPLFRPGTSERGCLVNKHCGLLSFAASWGGGGQLFCPNHSHKVWVTKKRIGPILQRCCCPCEVRMLTRSEKQAVPFIVLVLRNGWGSHAGISKAYRLAAWIKGHAEGCTLD